MKQLQPLQMRKCTQQMGPLSKSPRWLLTLFVSLLMLQAAAVVRRVDAGVSGGNGSGSSWANAYNNLQNAIDASSSGDQIWIKAGVYRANFNRFGTNSFSMKSGVKIYGGFDGGESSLSQRDIIANLVQLKPIQSANYPIVDNNSVDSTALLDGATLSSFENGIQTTGGAMRNFGSAFPSISNVAFLSNTASYPTGGGTLPGGGALYIEGGNAPITNVIFKGNDCVGNGGAVYMKNCTSTLTNVVFAINRATSGVNSYGGALYCEESAPKLVNVVFDGNYTGSYGGAVWCINTNSISSKKPSFTNCVFYNNSATSGRGGAIYAKESRPIVTNCTFALNWCGTGTSQEGGAIYTEEQEMTITNCLFKQNTYGNSSSSTSFTDIAYKTIFNQNFVTYSSFYNDPNNQINGTGNVAPVAAPFVNISDGDGGDNTWMTADDGLRLAYCNAFSVIDKGDNHPITLATDIRGGIFDRKVNVDFIPDGGSGAAPVIDMGAYEDQTDGITLLSITGTIGTSHTVPYPKESVSDVLANVQSPTLSPAPTYQWQSSTDSTNWTNLSGATAATYSLPSISQTTYYRRGATSTAVCGLPFYSNVVKIKIVTPNGVISGTIKNGNGNPVQGIKVYATRQQAISGGLAGHKDSATTGNDGTYTISPVYYGDPSLASSTNSFTVAPTLSGHTFNPASVSKTLTNNTPSATTVDFTDNTAIVIAGTTYQRCDSCTDINGAISPKTCPIDSVQIYKDGNFSGVYSGIVNSQHGRYATSVTVQGMVKIEPRLTGHIFSPAFSTISPVADITNLDFKDSTYHTISGKLTAGCSNYIGTAVLEFTDVLPPNPDGSVQASCFSRRVTTITGTGAFSIRLPARKYKVRVVNFSPATGANAVVATDVTDFFNTRIPADSLTREIGTRDTTLNLVYVRPPVIDISGGLLIKCTTPSPGFALIRQTESDSFKVKIYQGPASLGCPLAADTGKIRIVTNVQNEDQTEELRFAVADTGQKVKLTGGVPNITGDYLKNVFIYFTDQYNRTAPAFNRKVLVTGVKSDAATFTTVSPQVPLMVLHDPPGDASYSNWQSGQSMQNTLRFYGAASVGAEAWVQAKVGFKGQFGLIVSTEESVWGTVNASIGVTAKVGYANEAVITTTTTQDFSTANNPNVIGANGDVYIGAALNLIYAVATEIGYNNCAVTSKRRLMIADNGFNTTYIYSEDYIRNTLIPNLQSLAQLQPDSAARYLNQARVWQQVVNNNTANKAKAAFVQNYSFDGSAGPYTNTTTTASSKTNTVEFNLELDASVATEVGYEDAGSGISGGTTVKFKLETGISDVSTQTESTTIGYTLDDNDPGDYFSVNVKKDPVYNTPVFELAAGTASCPPEPAAQPRDAVFFTAQNPVLQNVNPSSPATFNLKIINTSPSTSTNPNDKRTYKLNYVQSSNVANETITIAGSPYQSTAPYVTAPLGYLDSAVIPVSITRQANSSVYSYEGERFSVSSNCGDDLGKTVAVSAYFTSPCSPITLTQPADGWVLSKANNNQIFIKPAGYTLSGLTSVNVQYSVGNNSSWNDGPFITTAQLAGGFNFDVSSLPEGATGIRLRLDCSTGTVYSQRATGIIDRLAPQLFGNADPTDDNYVAGDIIGFTYNENLSTTSNSLMVTVRRLSNNTLIPATVSIYNNKLIITPNSPIAGLTGDSIRVILSGISDVYGNVKLRADTTKFTVGTTVPATGSRALFVTISNPSVYKNNDTGAIKVLFTLPAPATNDTRVNYTIGGTARYGVDYTVSYTGSDALYASFNGSTGSIKIPTGSSTATLTLRPIAGDTAYSPDKTIVISASDGGDYSLGTPTSVTGYITSEDGIIQYIFTGDGNWNIRNNWQNNNMPLTTLVAPKEIIINPSGTCLLNIAQTIKPGAKITVKQNRRFVIQGSLKQQ